MSQKIVDLQDKISSERKRREEGFEQLSEAISGEVSRLYFELEKNKKEREMTHSRILGMAKEIE